ncbi:cytochrome P450, partial [Obelidium mucronatum]
MVEYFLKTKFGVFEKGPMFRSRAHDTLGHGIFASDGASWKSQRKLAAKYFQLDLFVQNFKDFVNQVFSAEMESLSSEFDLQDLFFKFTFDSFTKIGFGIEMHSLSASDTDIPFMSAFDRCPTGSGKRHACDVKIIREFGSEVIRQKRNTAPSQNQEFDQDENDLLSLLMKVKDETGETPTDELLVDYVLNFLIAGKHPKALKCLQKEIEAIVGGLQPTYEQIKSQMPYANAVFHETLRLYPSVPLEMKQASANDTLPDGTFVPKGCMVAWSPYAMGRTEAIWGKDAKEF